MPRRPRVFIEGGIYHVYNRFARRAQVFDEADEAERFLELLRAVKRRDGLTVFAWCLMSNHYHLAVRVGPVPLARTMGYVQARFGQGYNRRWRSIGPLWQSRYKARLVESERHLLQLIAYIHLNPVTAGLVDDPCDHRDSGHREIVKRCDAPLVDVDATLGIFGSGLRESRRAYARSLRGAREAGWAGEMPGRLPWWQHQPDAPLPSASPAVFVDELGRSTGFERPRLDAAAYLERACALLGVEPAHLAREGKSRTISRHRYLIAALGVERFGQHAKALGELLGRRADAVSRWVRLGAELRTADEGFRNDYESLDRALAAQPVVGPQ